MIDGEQNGVSEKQVNDVSFGHTDAPIV